MSKWAGGKEKDDFYENPTHFSRSARFDDPLRFQVSSKKMKDGGRQPAKEKEPPGPA